MKPENETATHTLPVEASVKMQRGWIVEITSAGEIKVAGNFDDLPHACDFLRTNAGPLPELQRGDAVLYAWDESTQRGCVLGVIEKYGASGQTAKSKPEALSGAHEFREIKLNAKEKIELRCGQSSLAMNKDGKVIIKGTQLTSRARGVNNIKGAAVKIN